MVFGGPEGGHSFDLQPKQICNQHHASKIFKASQLEKLPSNGHNFDEISNFSNQMPSVIQ